MILPGSGGLDGIPRAQGEPHEQRVVLEPSVAGRARLTRFRRARALVGARGGKRDSDLPLELRGSGSQTVFGGAVGSDPDEPESANDPRDVLAAGGEIEPAADSRIGGPELRAPSRGRGEIDA